MNVIPFPTSRPTSWLPLIMIAFPDNTTADERERTATIMRAAIPGLEFLVAHGGNRMFALPLGGDIGEGGRIVDRPQPTDAQMDDVHALLRDISIGGLWGDL
jgi:hypothetical protein